LISDLDLPKEQKNLANCSATKGAHPKIYLFLMIGRNVEDVRKEKFLLVILVVKDCVWELFISNSWKHSRQVVQQIYLLVKSKNSNLPAERKRRAVNESQIGKI